MRSKLITIITISLITFTLTEIIFRIYSNFNFVPFASDFGIPCIEETNDNLYYSLAKNCTKKIDYKYIEKKILFKTNSCRMRDEEDLCEKLKKQSYKKILFFGDSYTQNPYVKNKNNFSKILKSKLDKKKINYEVFNFGVSGYSLKQNLSKIKNINNEGVIKKGDYVIIQYLLNDIYDVRDNPPKKIKKYLNYFYSFRFINNLRRKIIYKDNYVDLQKMVEKDYKKIKNKNLIINSFCEINSIFKNKGINLIFLYLPYMEVSDNWNNYRLHSIEKNIVQYARKCGFKNIISLTEELNKNKYENLILSKKFNHHFNKYSNNIVAEILFHFIQSKYN